MLKIVEKETSTVPSFPDIAAVLAAQEAKRDQTGGVDLYPRDGTQELSELEVRVADMFGIRPGNLLLYGTGMSAVLDALEISRPTVGTTILRGYQHYSQAGNYISDDLRSRGVSVFATDPGSIEETEAILKARHPGIVFFETVTNGSGMATLDTKEFLQLPILQQLDPLIILDNTLPTSTGIPLGEIMEVSDRRIIGVESGTKFIGLNEVMCGVAYTYDADLLLRLKKRRQRTGSLLSAAAAVSIRKVMPKTAEGYHLRNMQIFRHTLRLARACLDNQSDGNVFTVVHPNLLSHQGSAYANACSSDGISPVFFIVPTDLGDNSHYQIADKLWGHPVISSLCDLGQSFGFERSRIWPDDNSPVVRISGGIYSPSEQVGLDQAFGEVLSRLR